MKFQSIRYSGSKDKILPKIDQITQDLTLNKVLDGFSGSTRVSQYFKHKGYNTTCNDLSIYSKHLGECYLLANRPHSYYKKIIDHLNNLNPTYGWFSENYGGVNNNGTSIQSDGLKRPFQMHVTEKLDSIRNEIDNLYPNDCVDKSVLLTSLMLALDGVCNDMGHHVSYLKDWSKKTHNNLYLKVPTYTSDNLQHTVLSSDVFDVQGNFDLCYFDPPYGTSNEKTKTTRVRYFSYYHLWTTVCKNDRPLLIGSSKRRYDVSSDSLPGAISEFESTKDEVVETSFESLVNNFDTEYTLISYSNRSKVKIDRLLEIISGFQKIVKVNKFDHKPNSQTYSVKNGEWKNEVKEPNYEYLILSRK